MPFPQKTFLELFHRLLPIEKAVFSETLYDLGMLNYRKKYFLPKNLRKNVYWLKTIPDDRKLSKKIEEMYDLTKKKHRNAYIENHLICLAHLKSLGVIDFSIFPFTFAHPKQKAIIINEENLKELLVIFKNFDKETLNIRLYEIVYDPPAIMLKDVEERIATTRYESQADIVFEYVYHHPNRDVTKEEINEYLQNKTDKPKINRDLDDIFEDMGFVGNLAKVFLKKKTKHLVHLRNPVYFQDLQEIGMEYCEPADLLQKGRKKVNAE